MVMVRSTKAAKAASLTKDDRAVPVESRAEKGTTVSSEKMAQVLDDLDRMLRRIIGEDVDLTLLPATKASRTKTTDLAIAYTCASGLSLGKWFVRARTTRRPTVPRTAPIFRTHDGCVWTSHYFRHTFLYPHLHRLRLAGDPALRPYDGSSPDNTIEAKFWSLHSYRRGGRTSVSRRHPGTVRKATPDEVNEHGRWAKKRESLDMPTLYAEWTLVQRLAITQLCM